MRTVLLGSRHIQSTRVSGGTWKKWLFVGVGFGAGVAVVAAAILACVLWYSSRPKQWNNRDIKATFSTALYQVNDDNSNIAATELEYVIENNTTNDFTLTPQQTFLLQDGGALRKSMTGNYKLGDQCFVPAKNKVRCQISVPADFDTTVRVDGFALFDDATRYSIIFPKPTSPTPDERAKFIIAMQTQQVGPK